MKKSRLQNVKIITKEVQPLHILQALQLDMISYPEEYHLKSETCIAYFEKNSRIYIMALDSGAAYVELFFKRVFTLLWKADRI